MTQDELIRYMHLLIKWFENEKYSFKIPYIYVNINVNKNVNINVNMDDALEIYTDNISFDFQMKNFDEFISAQYMNVVDRTCFSDLFEKETKQTIIQYLESNVDIKYFFNLNQIFCAEYELLIKRDPLTIYLIDFGMCYVHNFEDMLDPQNVLKHFPSCKLFFRIKNNDIIKEIESYRTKYLNNITSKEEIIFARENIIKDTNFNKEYMLYNMDKARVEDHQILYGGYYNKYVKYKSKYLKLKNIKI